MTDYMSVASSVDLRDSCVAARWVAVTAGQMDAKLVSPMAEYSAWLSDEKKVA